MAETTPLTGGTRGGAKDASERVKAQAIILYWKKMFYEALERGAKARKMFSYAFAGRKTSNTARTVSSWVALEDDSGMDALEPKRENCGRKSDFSPSKKAKIEELMEESEFEPTRREVQQHLGLGSHNTAADYVKLSGFVRLTKRAHQDAAAAWSPGAPR